VAYGGWHYRASPLQHARHWSWQLQQQSQEAVRRSRRPQQKPKRPAGQRSVQRRPIPVEQIHQRPQE
jgi:hypothetical protein